MLFPVEPNDGQDRNTVDQDDDKGSSQEDLFSTIGNILTKKKVYYTITNYSRHGLYNWLVIIKGIVFDKKQEVKKTTWWLGEKRSKIAAMSRKNESNRTNESQDE